MQVNDNNQARRFTAVFACICIFIQLSLVPYIGLANGRANLMLVFATIVALRYGGSFATVCGFFAGLLFDLTTTGPVGLMAFELTLTSYLLGRECRNRFSDDHPICVGMFLAANMCCSLVYNLTMLIVGESHSLFGIIFLRALPSFVLTCIPFFIAYYFLAIRSQASSFGGGGSHLKRGRTHYLNTPGS